MDLFDDTRKKKSLWKIYMLWCLPVVKNVAHTLHRCFNRDQLKSEASLFLFLFFLCPLGVLTQVLNIFSSEEFFS